MEELIQNKLQDYRNLGFEIVDQWNNRSGTPTQEGANNAIISKDGQQTKIGYMYEDQCWMPE